MNLKLSATGFGLAVVATLAFGVMPADAAKKRRAAPVHPQATGVTVRGPNVSYMSGPHTRIFVTKRSWLDAGTEVLPGERHYLDYAIPPGHQGGLRNLQGPAAPAGWQNPNWPLLGPFEAPQRDW
jgi:hypothetical protein